MPKNRIFSEVIRQLSIIRTFLLQFSDFNFNKDTTFICLEMIHSNDKIGGYVCMANKQKTKMSSMSFETIHSVDLVRLGKV